MFRRFLMIAVGLSGMCLADLAEAQPLSPFCQGVYARYRNSRGPKAFAVGSDGSCWYGFGQRDLAAAQRYAINACVNDGRPGCRIVESSF